MSTIFPYKCKKTRAENPAFMTCWDNSRKIVSSHMSDVLMRIPSSRSWAQSYLYHITRKRSRDATAISKKSPQNVHHRYGCISWRLSWRSCWDRTRARTRSLSMRLKGQIWARRVFGWGASDGYLLPVANSSRRRGIVHLLSNEAYR